MVENVPNLVKDINSLIQVAQQTPIQRILYQGTSQLNC